MGNRAMEMIPATPSFERAAHKASVSLAFPDLVRELVAIIGKKLTAYIAGAKDTRTIERWMEGIAPYNSPEERIRLAYHVAKMLAEYDSRGIVQSWFMGLNPDLGDRAPIQFFRDEDLATAGPRVLAAVRSFLAGG